MKNIQYTIALTIMLMAAINSKAQSSSSMTDGGSFLHFGIGFPQYRAFNIGLGTELSFDFGNTFMLYNNESDNFGVGVHVTWLTVGFSKESDFDYRTLSLRSMKTGLLGTYKLNEDMAIDAFIDATPTLNIGWSDDFSSADLSYGTLITPGVQFRYQKFSFSFEYSIGNVKTIDTDSGYDYEPVGYAIPRIALGFQF